jgi:transcriptional regulator with XRE-family HTH domain
VIVQDQAGWSERLRRARTDRRISQAELARRSGVSLAAVRAYEGGSRHPSRAALAALIDVLGLPVEDAHRMIADAGYAFDANALAGGRFPSPTTEQLQRDLDGRAWPAFITNQSFDVVQQNDAIADLLGVDADRELLDFGDRNLLAALSDRRFAERVCNWDEVATFAIGLAKGDPRWTGGHIDPVSPWLRHALERFLQGDPHYIGRFQRMWEDAPPIVTALRWSWRLEWRDDDGQVLSFACTHSIVDLWVDLYWDEWIPDNEAAWRRFHR